MNVQGDQGRLLLLCALRVDGQSIDWSLLAREASRDGGLDALWQGQVMESSKTAEKAASLLTRGLASHLAEAKDRVDQELHIANEAGATLVTVLDSDYPANLRLIPNRPPFLFMLGGPIATNDAFSVAVVGTRDASQSGLSRARQMAQQLVARGVTVVSGLAKGIDTAALSSAVDSGGRTIGVIGTGITQSYPKQNATLQRQVAERGAVVSQFWPSSGPATWTFPRRNVVMSGISQGTVVIEASGTSGAKMQARIALEHHKRVFLVRSLVADQPWAQKYSERRGAVIVENVDDVIEHLADPLRVSAKAETRQMTLSLV